MWTLLAMLASPASARRSSVSKLDDQIWAEQIEAAVNEAAEFLRGIVANNPDVKVRQLAREGLRILATRMISTYEVKVSEQRRVYGSTLLDAPARIDA